MAKIKVGEHSYQVVEKLGFNHDMGGYAAIVMAGGRERTIVKQGTAPWRFWSADDRAQPLIDAMARGWR